MGAIVGQGHALPNARFQAGILWVKKLVQKRRAANRAVTVRERFGRSGGGKWGRLIACPVGSYALAILLSRI
jgi:hypothetical protein